MWLTSVYDGAWADRGLRINLQKMRQEQMKVGQEKLSQRIKSKKKKMEPEPELVTFTVFPPPVDTCRHTWIDFI
jgi:hypothetical protein